VRYLVVEEILAIHERLLEADGGLAGIRDVSLLFSLAERPKTIVMGREVFPDLFMKAAIYVESLTVYRVFSDGNKRTALAAASVFLEANGVVFLVLEKEGFRWMLAIAQKKKTIQEITEWLKKHSSS